MTIICGDCLEVMKQFPDNYFSAIVTDPPYGLSFMGKGWDHAVPSIEYWTECLRISKPGSFLVAMGGTRTFHRLAIAIEETGWEIRDTLMWIYGSGFPKSHNHFGLAGYGTALKPAYEPIVVASKPVEGNYRRNAEKWGQAGINIDECRIPTHDRLSIGSSNPGFEGGYRGGFSNEQSAKGRWPANVILDEEAGKMLGDPARFFYCPKASSRERNQGLEGLPDKIGGGMCSTVFGETRTGHVTIQKNNHPTVKPLALMEYLIKLVMPTENGILLDPFAGSGTTILAAQRLGFEAIGIEKSEQYCEIARKRCEIKTKEQMDMFV